MDIIITSFASIKPARLIDILEMKESEFISHFQQLGRNSCQALGRNIVKTHFFPFSE